MKIAIDCRSLRKKPAGVPNFLLSFISTLSIQHKNVELILLSNEQFSAEAEDKLKGLVGVKLLISPLIIFPKIAILWYIMKVPFLIRKIKPTFFYTPIPNLPPFLFPKTKCMITVHDMVFKHFPKTMAKGNWLINFFLHNRSIKSADWIWAVSDYTRQEIELNFPYRKSKEIYVGSSIDKAVFKRKNFTESDRLEFISRYSLSPKYILFVGTLEPRKNINFLIKIMPRLSEHNFELLVVGIKGWGKISDATWDDLIKKGKVKLSGYISTEDLVRAYHFASVFVSTSINEGFGLPQLEAMNCGCPVVSAHNSAMIEVVGNGGETIRGWDEDLWVSTILKVAENREAYCKSGLQKAEQYDWNKVVAGLVNRINRP